jgi:hypothetical protein
MLGRTSGVNGSSASPATYTIGAYASSPGIYQCPADPSIAKPYGVARCRSESMNFAVGSRATNSLTGTYDTWPNFFKMNDFKIPAKTWVFSDEHPDSINDMIQFTP